MTTFLCPHVSAITLAGAEYGSADGDADDRRLFLSHIGHCPERYDVAITAATAYEWRKAVLSAQFEHGDGWSPAQYRLAVQHLDVEFGLVVPPDFPAPHDPVVGPLNPADGAQPYRPGLRTPRCAPDTSGWTLVISGDDLVQVSTSCRCGDDGCAWHAAVYANGWYQ